MPHELGETVMIIDYVRVILAGPVLYSGVAIITILVFRKDIKALILRVAKIKLGGAEVSTPQSLRSSEEKVPGNEPKVGSTDPIQGLPDDLTQQQKQSVEQLIRSHIATAYLWEYRFLNYYLVSATQMVLDWLISAKKPMTFQLYDSTYMLRIASANERKAIIDALETHRLVDIDTNYLIHVTTKGREYQQWGERCDLTSV